MSDSQPPNILFLMSDEHRADVLGFNGNQTVRTPSLDGLAEQAVIFSNAYTPSPICVPARQCIASGQLPTTCGCRTFNSDLPPFSTTFAEQLSRFGYITSCHGKLHHRGRDQMQGWSHRGFGDMEVADWDRSILDAAYKCDPPESGTGKWSGQKEVERTCITSGMTGDLAATESAIQYAKRHFADNTHDRPQNHRPLLLKLYLQQPHYPYQADEEKLLYYLNRVRPYLNQPIADHPVLGRSQNNEQIDVSDRDIRRATAAYYSMVETVDTLFGRLLNALEHLGEDLDGWIVVFTSDHGEMLGQHGIWEKTRFYEGSVKVPLFIRWPQQFNSRNVSQNVNLCDLFATFCELTGTPLPGVEDTVGGAGLDSRSLCYLLEGRDQEWESQHGNESISMFGERHLMIKSGDLKYQWYGRDCPEVLFDLSSDPGEYRNCIQDRRYTDAVAKFSERRRGLGFN